MTVLIPVLSWFAPIVAGIIVYRAHKRIDAAGDRALEEFKHGLERASAAANFDYQRQLQDFNLYVAKKHEVLAELYKLIVEAHGTVFTAARGSVGLPVFSDHNAEDAERYMVEAGYFPIAKRKMILDLWDSDREEATRLLHEHIKDWQPEEARRALAKALNFRLRHELYLPDEISKAAADVTDGLYWLSQVYSEVTNQKEYQARLENLKQLMKAAIARGELAPSTAIAPMSSAALQQRTAGM